MSAQESTGIPTVPNSQGLISIERVVAFVLGPIVIAASGTLSAWLSTKVGIKVTPKEIEGAFATGGLAAGAGVWKWLNGRQKTPIVLNDGRHILNTVSGVVEDLGITHDQQASVERQVIGLLEEHAHDLANHIAAKIQMAGTEIHITNPGKTSSASVETSHETVESPVAQPEPAEPPIEPAAGDPAPETPIEAELAPAPPVAPPPIPPTGPAQPPAEAPRAPVPPTPPAGVGG